MPALTLSVTGGIRYRVHAVWIECAIFTYTCTEFLRAAAIKTERMFLSCFCLPSVWMCVICVCLPRLWLYTLLRPTGPESRFLLASTPLLQPALVSLIPDGRVSDKCTLSKGEESSPGFEKMYVGLTRGKVLPPPPPYFFSCNLANTSFKLLGGTFPSWMWFKSFAAHALHMHVYLHLTDWE